MECYNIKCKKEFWADLKKIRRTPSRRHYCVQCRKTPYKIFLKCPTCEDEFQPTAFSQKFCSRDCVLLARDLKHKKHITCKICHSSVADTNHSTCGKCEEYYIKRFNELKTVLHARKDNMECIVCGEEVSNRLYCSHNCSMNAAIIRRRGN